MKPDWNMNTKQVVHGVVTFTRVFSPATEWGIVALTWGDGDKNFDITAVGNGIGAICAGDSLEVRGEWGPHKKYGAQLKIESFARVLPRDIRATEAWLCQLPQIGPTRARAIAKRWTPEELWEMIQQRPAELLSIPGITDERAQEISAAYAVLEANREAEMQLMDWGWTAIWIAKFKRLWGDDLNKTISLLAEDPYKAMQVRGIGFPTADTHAAKMGIDDEDPRRVRAAWLHVLTQAMRDSGDTWVSSDAIANGFAELAISLEVAAEHESEELVEDDDINGVHCGALRTVADQERRSADWILALRGSARVKFTAEHRQGELEDRSHGY